MIYEIAIIGGGISGLYCALKLSFSHKVILFEKNNYLGGRIHTNTDEHIEMGATRYNKSHHLLSKLLQEYHITGKSEKVDYSFISKDNQQIIPKANIILQNYISFIIRKSKLIPEQELRDKTFKDFCLVHTPTKYVNLMESIFGYSSEFEVLNAYDAIRGFQSDFLGTQYYHVPGGLSTLILKIQKTILKNKGVIKTHHEIVDISRNLEGHYQLSVQKKKRSYYCQNLIMSINPYQLQKIPYLFSINGQLKRSISGKPLLKIFAKYPCPNNQCWFSGLTKITTNSILRQIIRIDKQQGLILVSYTDGNDTFPFLRGNNLKSETEIKKIITRELNLLFSNMTIPSPLKIYSYYWPIGAHYWKPGVNSTSIINKINNSEKNMYICGEFLSSKQAWIEGALESSQRVINHFIKNKTKKQSL